MFPSIEHRAALGELRRNGQLAGQDRWQWFAYDYGWRRVAIDAHDSLIDPDGKWFNTGLANIAEQFWRRHFAQRKPRRGWVSAADEAAWRGDDDAADRLRQQDLERAALKARIPRGTEDSPETAAFVDCCIRQVRANCAEFAARQRPKRNHDADRDALRRARQALGTSAKEAAE